MSDSIFGLQYFYAGSEDCRPLHRWKGIRDHWFFHFISRGRGLVTLPQQRRNLEEGQGFLVAPHTEVEYQADREAPWSYSWVACSGPEAATAFRSIGLGLAQPWYLPSRPNLEAGQEFRRLVDRLSRESDPFLQIADLLAAFGCLRRHQDLPDWGTSTEGLQESYAALVDDFIRRNYSRHDARIETWAQQIGLSRKHLSEVVRDRRGASPRALLTEYRLAQAAELLASTALSIGAVAASVGYNDPLAFSRAFRQRYATSPRGWRQGLTSPTAKVP